MIRYLRGKLVAVDGNNVIIDVNGVGYGVTVPIGDALNMCEGSEVLVHTYLNVREDIMELYGSVDKEVMKLFKKLIDVSGIGPKIAIGILSKVTVNDLITAIVSEDVSFISTCPGIGKKTSERLILELKDKLCLEGGMTSTSNSVKEEAYEALISLGYKKGDSKKIIDKIYKKGMNIEEVIKAALSNN